MQTIRNKVVCCLVLFLFSGAFVLNSEGGAIVTRCCKPTFRAGAYAQDISPEKLPIVINGSFRPAYYEHVLDNIHARCLVLDDGKGSVVLVTVDSCMLDRELLDNAKELASKATGIPVDRMFISVTHTHSAPASVSVLGTDYDPEYRAWLPGKIAEGIIKAQQQLKPAEIGWSVKYLGMAQNRRWITRPDKILIDPFGELTTRATMHPGYRNPDWQEPSGPSNPDLNVIAVRALDGTPIALYGNNSIHYVGIAGARGVSADYYGVFCRRIAELLGFVEDDKSFVGLMSNGVSGDMYIRDYTLEKQDSDTKESIAEEAAQLALESYKSIKWHTWLPLDVCNTELTLKMREPKLEWAKKTLARIEAGEKIEVRPATYAREQVLLSQMSPERHLKLQSIRIGNLAIVGIPCEVFSITGLRIAAESPFEHTFTVMLANGYDGYLPPPEQLAMGGYTTWLARSSCLETEAEPKIRVEVGKLLQELGRDLTVKCKSLPPSAYVAAVKQAKPLVYWRLDDLDGPQARNEIDGQCIGKFGMPTGYYMPGIGGSEFPGLPANNRVPHFIGAPLTAQLKEIGNSYTVELWFYNCMPNDAREVTGYLFGRGKGGDSLAIGGTASGKGCLIFHTGAEYHNAKSGKTVIPLRNWNNRESWHHVVMVRNNNQVAVYLDGNATPEITVEATNPVAAEEFWVGGNGSDLAPFEGRIDEVAIYPRALSAAEVAAHYQAAVK